MTAVLGAVASSVGAAIPDRYQTILSRNPFGLVPPPVIEEAAVVAPPVEIKVTGFATLAGKSYVYMAIPSKTSKDQYQYLTLREGGNGHNIEVLEILTSTGEVRINNSGAAMLLSLQKNGFQGAKGLPQVAQAPQMPQQVSPVSQSPVYNYNAGAREANMAAIGNVNPYQGVTPMGVQNQQSTTYPSSMQGGGRMPVSSQNSTIGNLAANSSSVVYQGINQTTTGQEHEQVVVDPIKQMRDIKQYEDEARQNGGKVPVVIPTPTSPVVAPQEPTVKWVHAPPPLPF